jgi:hypothetical protein
VTVLAAIRPDSVNFPLFLHVLGAMLLVGTLLAVATAIVLGWRRADALEVQALTRFGLLTLLLGVLPSYILMRVGAQWTESRENLPKPIEDSAWMAIGYITADAGALLVIVSIVLSAIGLRRLKHGGGAGFGRAVGVISLILLAAYVVAVWAMTAKPD